MLSSILLQTRSIDTRSYLKNSGLSSKTEKKIFKGDI
jgi:hypothetical protein